MSYDCEICSIKFTTKRRLNSHIESEKHKTVKRIHDNLNTKYQQDLNNLNNQLNVLKIELQSKNEIILNIINELNDKNKEIKHLQNKAEEYRKIVEKSATKTTVKNNNNYTQPIPKKESYMQNTVDPIIQMFRNAKRNTDFQISFSINNKIPRVDFIEMMEDSYNTSIIDFLAEEFTNEILLNPEILKNRIKEQIKTRVYGLKESEPKVESPKTSVRKKTIKTND